VHAAIVGAVAIIGSVFALVGRFAGRLVNSALGWATILLFGKVEGRKQSVLLIIALGSLLWVLTLVGVIVPDVGTFMLAFVPVPDFIDEDVVRLAMLGAAALIPLLIGVAAVAIADPATRPRRLGLVGGVLRGYPFTVVLALTIVILAVVALVRKVRSLARRWEDAHIPLVVKPGGYDAVLEDIEGVLDRSGLDVRPGPAPAVLSIPPKLLDAVAGRALGGLVPDRLMLLHGAELEVLVYPSDVAISGTRTAVARARAAIADQLTHSPAYLTVSAEAERIEDDLRALAPSAGGEASNGYSQVRGRLREIDDRLSRLTVPFDEWETVYRERLQVERDALVRELDLGPSDANSVGRSANRPKPIEWVFAAAGMALLAVDVALVLGSRIAIGRRRS
jgi:hypothetical protein